MTRLQHRDLASGRWGTLTLAEQLGHVGSEISRALRWQDRDAARADAAFARALELMDLTLDDPRHRRLPARLRELARTREVIVDFFAGPNVFGTTARALQAYFDAFALAARRRHDTATQDGGKED